ncbi:MAG: solute carrier family 26 protein [Bacteroidota bacterium]
MNIRSYLPFLEWLPNYKRSWFKNDIMAGITVGVMLIPQGIAYATIAGLPPIYGLYTAMIPQIVYAFLGTSRQLAVGPAAMDSLIVASGVGALAAIGSEHFIILAIVLAFMIGFFQLLFGIFKLGFLVNFLSRPVISGFTSGSAIIIASNQIGNLLGVDIPRDNHIQFLVKNILSQIGNIHSLTFIIGLGAIVILFLLKFFTKRIPASLVIVILGIVVVYIFGLKDSGLAVIGNIPQGLPEFTIPTINKEIMKELSSLSLTLALIGFMEAISIAKSMEAQHNDNKVRPNQELIALGFGNMIGSFFQTFTATAGFARSAVNDQSGAKTPLSSIFAAIIVGITLLFLTPLFYYLPKTVLAAIIIVAAYGLLDFVMPKKLLTYNIRDLIILNTTLFITIIFGIKEGILTGIVFSLAMLIYKSTKPHMAVLGNVPGTHFYRNITRFKNVIIKDEILIVRFDAQLYFANTTYFKDTLLELVKEKGEKLRLLIIDGESINALDSSAIYALEEIHNKLTGQGISIAFTGLKGPVRDTLAKSGLMKKIRFDHCFMSIQEAVDCYDQMCMSKSKKYSYQEYTKQINR